MKRLHHIIPGALLILFLTPATALANDPYFAPSLTPVFFITLLYIGGLFITRRSADLNAWDLVIWIGLFIITTYIGHSEITIYTWMFYMGAHLAFMILIKDRVVFLDRKKDLRWYAAWTGAIIIIGGATTVGYWIHKGNYIANLVEGKMEILIFFALLTPFIAIAAARALVKGRREGRSGK